MEVHHPHHPTHKKAWKEYITEFIMLFAAVSLGFLAENIREHQIEMKRGKDYLSDLHIDLKNDSISLQKIVFQVEEQRQAADSIYAMYRNGNWESRVNELYFFYAIISLRSNWEPNDATWEQAISSGTLRYIEDKELQSKLKGYYFLIKNMKNRESRILKMMDDYFEYYRQNHFISPSITANKDLMVVMDIINKSTKPKMPIFSKQFKILNRDKFHFETFVNCIARTQGTRNLDLTTQIAKCIELNKELLRLIENRE